MAFSPDGKLSPNNNLLAVRTQRNQVAIYRLVTPYTALADDATATASFIEEQEQTTEERVLSLRPTATQGFTYLGEPRPTLTPTVMPTSPPLPEEIYFSEQSEVEEVCPYTESFTLDNPPPDFAVNGRIITTGRWVLHPATGDYVLDDTLPECVDNGCQFSFDLNWIFYVSLFARSDTLTPRWE